nr:transporter [uncultured Flavobacterium sp.]
MKLKNFMCLSAFLAFCTTMNAQYTEEINSNRPGQSMGAFAVGKTIFQVEAGLNGIYEKHELMRKEAKGGFADLTLRYGAFVEQLEFVVDMQYRADYYEHTIYDEFRTGITRFNVGAKYMVYDPDKNYRPKQDIKSWWANRRFKWRTLIPAVGVYAGLNVFNSTQFSFPEDKTSFKGMVILQHHFNSWVWVNNFLIDKANTPYPTTGWITTVTRGFNKHWSGFLEYQALKSDYYADAIVRTGAAYLSWENLQFDASISANFKNTPTIAYAGVGVSWRFNADYKDILMPGKGDREDEMNKQKEKEQKEKDKRKKDREARRKALQESPIEPAGDPATDPSGGR